nr:lactosylceramide 4-alpha-galactosyltransferase-like [Procambarus clarkii]
MRAPARVLVPRVAVGTVVLCFIYTSGPRGETSQRPTTPQFPSSKSEDEEEWLAEDISNGSSVCPTPKVPPHDFLKLRNIFSLKEAQQEEGTNILLLESSCAVKPTVRAWCALESLAQQNPEARVWYVMTAPLLEVKDGLARRLLHQYTNLQVVTADLQEVFSHTPLMRLYTSGSWNANTQWPEVNLADLMRLGLVWHLGGFYVDTDVVCIRPLTGLANAIGWQEMSTLGSGVFHFSRHHPVLQRVMARAARTFKTNKWGSSGPHAFTWVMKELCGGEVLMGGKAGSCQGIRLLPIRAFYPVPAPVWRTLFTFQTPREVTERYLHSYMIHTWNQLSHSQPVVKGSGSIYDQAAKVFCPVTRAHATTHDPLY